MAGLLRAGAVGAGDLWWVCWHSGGVVRQTYGNGGMVILQGNALSIPLSDASVNCVVTSPPYYGLRDYGIAGQLGLEPTPDAYVANLVAVFREVKRVLKKDGVCWLNLGDSYAAQISGTLMPAETLAGGIGGHERNGRGHRGRRSNDVPDGVDSGAGGANSARSAHRDAAAIGLKHKDLIGIPWRVAFALQADGWWLRSDIIWAKPNPMPESVTDRPTRSHEYVFLLSKSARYWYDAKAIAEEAKPESKARYDYAFGGPKNEALKAGDKPTAVVGDRASDGTRNARSVWTIATKPFKGAHFATFPPELAKRCILAGCPSDGIVLDPFSGSGTTVYVAHGCGRRAIGLDLSAEYCRMAQGRNGFL